MEFAIWTAQAAVGTKQEVESGFGPMVQLKGYPPPRTRQLLWWSPKSGYRMMHIGYLLASDDSNKGIKLCSSTGPFAKFNSFVGVTRPVHMYRSYTCGAPRDSTRTAGAAQDDATRWCLAQDHTVCSRKANDVSWAASTQCVESLGVQTCGVSARVWFSQAVMPPKIFSSKARGSDCHRARGYHVGPSRGCAPCKGLRVDGGAINGSVARHEARPAHPQLSWMDHQAAIA